MSSHTIDRLLFQPATTKSTSLSTTTNSKSPKPPSQSEDTIPLLTGKGHSWSDRIPVSPPLENNPRASILSEKSYYRPPSEIHPAFSNQANPSVDTLPAYSPYAELVPGSQNSHAKKKWPISDIALKVVAHREGSRGRSRGIRGVGNYVKGQVRGE